MRALDLEVAAADEMTEAERAGVELIIDALGEPIPQGSKTPVKRGAKVVLIEDNPRLAPWRREVTARARARVALTGWRLLDGPCRVDVLLLFDRPPAAARRRYPHVKPDADKCARAIGDALTGVVYVDDSRIVELNVRKRYTIGQAGARITVTALDGQTMLS